MKKRLIQLLGIVLLLVCPVLSQAQINYQYWIDNNIGAAVSGTTTANGDISLAIDMADQTPGIHFYNLRAREGKKWGPVYRYLFAIPHEQQTDATRMITGYRYGFGDEMTTVTFDTPISEYTLNQPFDVPVPPLPTVIDDDCHFSFSDDEATLLRNITMEFALTFTDESNAMSSPIGTSFTLTDTHTSDIQTLEVAGSLPIEAHAQGGYSVVTFTIQSAGTYILKSSAACNLRLFSSDGAKITDVSADALIAGYSHEYEAGTYYVVAFGNENEITLTVSICDVNLLKPTLTYADNQVTITCAVAGATVYYTLDGTDPTTESTLYETPIPVDCNMTIKAIAVLSGIGTSPIASLDIKSFTVETPVITHEGNVLSITTATEGATIYYTLDGTTPTIESNVYTSPFTVTENGTIKAIAVKEGYENSAVADFNVNWIVVNTCGYAIYDKNKQTLTFYYGIKPEDNRTSEGIWVYDADKTVFESYACHNPWYSTDITTVIFDSSFAKARPKTTAGWFYGCDKLTEIIGIEHLNTEKVLDMEYMFYQCSSLTNIDLSHFNTAKVGTGGEVLYALRGSMHFMFASCYNLTHIDISSFEISDNLTDPLDMQHMFSLCSGLKTVDISGFKNIHANMNGFFNGCSKLTTIYVSEDWSNQYITGSKMFQGCTNLVGGKGTVFQSNQIEKSYAIIDGGTDSPGYFTDKASLKVGDVNGDNVLDAKDITDLIAFIAGKSPNGVTSASADVNSDGVVNIADIVMISNMVARK